jgi:VanZ family protein
MAQYIYMEKRSSQRQGINRSVYKTLYAWVPVLLWMLVIFTLSSRQRIVVSPEYILNFLFFKTLHVLEYGALFTLLYRALRISRPDQKQKLYMWAFIITILYATSDEFHQTFVPTREGAVRDVIIDGIGASIIWFFLSTQLPKAHKKLKNLAHSLGLTSYIK